MNNIASAVKQQLIDEFGWTEEQTERVPDHEIEELYFEIDMSEIPYLIHQTGNRWKI